MGIRSGVVQTVLPNGPAALCAIGISRVFMSQTLAGPALLAVDYRLRRETSFSVG
jgi:hypothetical protein